MEEKEKVTTEDTGKEDYSNDFTVGGSDSQETSKEEKVTTENADRKDYSDDFTVGGSGDTKKKGKDKKKPKEPKPSKPEEGMAVVHEVKRENFFKRALRKYDFKLLQQEIEDYGYKYSFKDFALISLIFVGIIGGVSWFVHLNLILIICLFVLIMGLVPFIIRSQFAQLYQVKRFEMITGYLDNVLPVFKKVPIITSAWAEILDLLEGEMQEAVQEAYDLVMNNTDDPDVLQTAFAIIESHFPNSRIHSVHQLMYSIETKNTQRYHAAVDNIWTDVQGWVSRITAFQNDLKKRKADLLLLSLLTIGMSCIFTTMYNSNDVFKDFDKNILYQGSTFLFMGILIIVMFIFQVKLNGKWLLDDKTISMDKRALKSFEYITCGKHDASIRKQDKIIAVVTALLGIVLYVFTRSTPVAVLMVFAAFMMYSQNKRTYKNHVNNVKKFVKLEFPSWLQGVAINLQNLTVVNSIEASKDTSTTIMCHYLNILLNDIYNNPNSIVPFNDFLKDFNLSEVRTSMKSLFSAQFIAKDDVERQTNDIIIRNQDLLAKAEKTRSESQVGNLKLLGFVPVVLLVAQMIINMIIMFSIIMSMMTVSVAM